MTGQPAPRAFVSYARKDGELFATALRRRLAREQPEIGLWLDHAELEGGEDWWLQITRALDRVKFLIIVLTEGAIESRNTVREWRYARQRGVIVYPVKGSPGAQLDDESLPGWMRHAHVFDLGRVVDGEWRDEKEWDTFVNYLKSDRLPVRVPFMAPDLPRDFVPRVHEFNRLLELVLDSSRREAVIVTTTLEGSGGYGKTTLAAALCHDERITDTFDSGVLWTSLGQAPNLLDELARLYEALTGERPAFLDTTQASSQFAEKLESRRLLIVIDDVWQSGHLEPFLRGGPECARIVTTRRRDLLARAARVRVDGMHTGECVQKNSGTIGGALAIPGDQALTWGPGEMLRVWDTNAAEPVPKGHAGPVDGAVLLSDTQAFSWGRDRRPRAWDLDTGRSRQLPAAAGSSIEHALAMTDEWVLTWGTGPVLRAFNMTTDAKAELIGHSQPIQGALGLGGTRALSWSLDGNVCLWHIETGAARAICTHEGGVEGARLLDDGRVLSWGRDGTVKIGDLATGEQHTLSGHEGSVLGALPLPNGVLLSWSASGSLWRWDLSSYEGREERTDEETVSNVLAMPDGRVLVHGADLYAWDVASGDVLTLDDVPIYAREQPLLLPSGLMLMRTLFGLDLWDLSTGQKCEFAADGYDVTRIDLLPDGRTVWLQRDRSVRVRDIGGASPDLSFFFDAMPTIVLSGASGRLVVGDSQGSLHVLEEV